MNEISKSLKAIESFSQALDLVLEHSGDGFQVSHSAGSSALSLLGLEGPSV